MTSQPQTIDTDSLPEPTKLHLALIEAMERGMTPGDIAKKLAPGDSDRARTRRKTLRAKIRRMLNNDPILQRAIMQHAQGNLVAGLPGATAAAVKRAHRGRMDAVKFVTEATGFHNPRVQHDHSGEVKIKIDIPRPNFADAEAVGDDHIIEEADVVEDGSPAEA